MSHRKYSAPRHGSMAFSPRKRTTRHQGHIRTFPVDDRHKPVHLTAFIGFKAGMTHIVRELDCPGSKAHKKEIVEPVTILETPPMVVIGIVGYKDTHYGKKPLATLWSEHIADEAKRRFTKRWGKMAPTCFANQAQLYENGAEKVKEILAKIKSEATVVRAILHTQYSKLRLVQKRAQIMEIQVNGGSISDKVDWVFERFEREIPVTGVFESSEVIDCIGITKGKGFQGTTKRWGTTKLPRKTNKGIRKVACIGPWHPPRVMHTVARPGQMGYHHRTEIGKKIYLIGTGSDPKSGSTDADITVKTINPMGGFINYGKVQNDFIMIKGCCMGAQKRPITLRKPIVPRTKRSDIEKISLKFIDTSSKIGHGRFQTSLEKKDFMGPMKRDQQIVE